MSFKQETNMGNIKLIIKETPTSQQKETLVPEESLKEYQRVFGNQLIDFFKVDDKGKRLQEQSIVNRNPKEIALKLLQERAERLKVKGWKKMSEEQLVQAIQKESQKQS